MRRRTHITSFTVTCATPGCARAQSVPLVHPGWRIKPSLRIKASTEGFFFVCLFLFFSLKMLMDIIVKMAWNCRRICEEVLRSKTTTTTLSAQSYPEKGSFENEMWSLHKPSPRLWKKSSRTALWLSSNYFHSFCLCFKKFGCWMCCRGQSHLANIQFWTGWNSSAQTKCWRLHKNKLQIGELSLTLSAIQCIANAWDIQNLLTPLVK